MNRPMNRHGFMLVEILAAILLSALVAGLLTVNLSSMSELASRRSLVAELQGLDARARLWARSAGPLLLTTRDEGRVLCCSEVRSGEVRSRVEVPEEASVSVKSHAEQDFVLFDRLGRSEDYELELAWTGKEEEEKQGWKVSGATGWFREKAEPKR